MLSIDVTDVLRLLTATDCWIVSETWLFSPLSIRPSTPPRGPYAIGTGPSLSQLSTCFNLYIWLYLYLFLFNIFQWWIMVDSSLMDAVWCLPWPLVRVMIQGYSRNLNSFAKDAGRSQQRVCHGSADCRPGGVCTSLAPTDFGSLTLLEYADACA